MNFVMMAGLRSYPRYVLVTEKLAKRCYLKEINKIDNLKNLYLYQLIVIIS